jgi:hypothetical protein
MVRLVVLNRVDLGFWVFCTDVVAFSSPLLVFSRQWTCDGRGALAVPV